MPVWLRLILVLTVAAILLTAIAAYLIAQMLLRPPRMTDGKAAWILKRLSPGDLGLSFTPVDYRVRDALTGSLLKISAWWIPHARAEGRCAILIHGYADAKVGAIAWAPMFYALGWNILAVDLRAHGESEGRFTTAGYFERHDLNQTIDQLRAELPDETRQLIIFGVSLGAAVAVATAAMRDDIAAIILDSPMMDFRDAATRHLKMLGLSGSFLPRLSLAISKFISKADFAQVSLLKLLPRVPCPVMLICGQQDALISPRQQEEIRKIIRERAPIHRDQLWEPPQTGHLLAMRDQPDAYLQNLADFLAIVEKKDQLIR